MWWFARGRAANGERMPNFNRTRLALAAASKGLYALLTDAALHERDLDSHARAFVRVMSLRTRLYGPGWRQRMGWVPLEELKSRGWLKSKNRVMADYQDDILLQLRKR